MKKHYLKPDAEYIAFYSDEEIAADLDIKDYANENNGGDISDLSNVQKPGIVPPGLDWD